MVEILDVVHDIYRFGLSECWSEEPSTSVEEELFSAPHIPTEILDEVSDGSHITSVSDPQITAGASVRVVGDSSQILAKPSKNWEQAPPITEFPREVRRVTPGTTSPVPPFGNGQGTTHLADMLTLPGSLEFAPADADVDSFGGFACVRRATYMRSPDSPEELVAVKILHAPGHTQFKVERTMTLFYL